jgi:hypothetical protein
MPCRHPASHPGSSRRRPPIMARTSAIGSGNASAGMTGMGRILASDDDIGYAMR